MERESPRRPGVCTSNVRAFYPCHWLRRTSNLITYLRLDNLFMRYEEPSSMVRWDSPLFTVPWTDDDVPADDIWRAITEGTVKPPNAGTQAVRSPDSV